MKKKLIEYKVNVKLNIKGLNFLLLNIENLNLNHSLKTQLLKLKNQSNLKMVFKAVNKFGRLEYSSDHKINLLGFCTDIRNLILSDYIEIDLVSAHPTLVFHYAKLLNLNCNLLKKYLSKTLILDETIDQKKFKQIVLLIINGGNPDKIDSNWLKNSLFKDFYIELKIIIKNLNKYFNKKYSYILPKKKIEEHKKISYYLNFFESLIIEKLILKYPESELIPNRDSVLVNTKTCKNINLGQLLSDSKIMIFQIFNIDFKLKIKNFKINYAIFRIIPKDKIKFRKNEIDFFINIYFEIKINPDNNFNKITFKELQIFYSQFQNLPWTFVAFRSILVNKYGVSKIRIKKNNKQFRFWKNIKLVN